MCYILEYVSWVVASARQYSYVVVEIPEYVDSLLTDNETIPEQAF